jgi:hypothetical protein
VSDGLARFTGEARVAAQDALLSAQLGCFDNPIERLLIQKVRIVSLELKPEGCPEADIVAGPNYRAVLKSYTVFGIPTAIISVCRGEVICYRYGASHGSLPE